MESRFRKTINQILLGLFLVVSLAVAGTFVSTSLTKNSALADDSVLTTSLSLNFKTNGDSNGASAKLEKTAYNSGETVIVKWNGAKVNNQFVVPTSISFNNKTYSMSQIIELDKLQSINTAYKKEMSETVTMTSFEDFSNFATSTHSFSLGKQSVGGNITVNFAKVAPVYRMYNKLTSEHLFTTSKSEYDKFAKLLDEGKDVWIGEGIDWLSPTSGTSVQRLYNPALGSLGRNSHYYTSDVDEIKNLITNQGWVVDAEENWYKSGVASGASCSIYTAYNELLGSAHHYTSSWEEWRGLDAGWDKEEKKNGLARDGKSAAGVGTGLMATNWRFVSNFYQVQHKINGEVVDTQFVQGKAGDKTSATALSVAGYRISGTIAQKTIASDNSTVVAINYEADDFSITFNMNGHGTQIASSRANYGSRISAPTAPRESGWTFGGWYYDSNCTVGKEVSWTTMPATNMTVYAKWTVDSSDIYWADVVKTNELVYCGTEQEQDITVALFDAELVQGKDFTITNNKATDAGSHELVITGIGKYTGTKKFTWEIERKTIWVAWPNSMFVYNGNPQAPTPVLYDGEVEAVDVGKVGVKVTEDSKKVDAYTEGEGYEAIAELAAGESGDRSSNYELEPTSVCTSFKIYPADISSAKVNCDSTSFVHDGTAKCPTVQSVVVDGVTLTAADFEVSVTPQTEVGSNYTLTVTGKGNYTRKATVTWSITSETV